MSWMVEGNGCLDHVPIVIINTGDELTGDGLFFPRAVAIAFAAQTKHYTNNGNHCNEIAEFTHGPQPARPKQRHRHRHPSGISHDGNTEFSHGGWSFFSHEKTPRSLKRTRNGSPS